MNRVRVKVCGITTSEDAEFAVHAGVDAIGMILHAPSPRRIDVKAAMQIRESVPAFVSLVGVLVDAPLDSARRLYDEIGLDLLQLHGNEDEHYALELDRPYIKAIRARDKQFMNAQIRAHSGARAYLIDPYVKGQHGGTGQRLSLDNWPRQESVGKPLVLAGGLEPENIESAISEFNPYAVDLNSGVEKVPGQKSSSKILQAMKSIHSINNEKFSHH